MTVEEGINGRDQNIGKACVVFYDAAMKLQRVFICHRQAKETAEAAETRTRGIRNTMEKTEASREVTAALEALGKAEQEMARLTNELNAATERIKRLLNTDFTITVSAEELLRQFEDQLKNPIYGG